MASLHHIIVANVFFLLVTYSSAFDAQGSYCGPGSGIDSGGPVSTNIARLLTNMTHQFEHGATFLESSSGKGNDLVYGLAQCRGDTDQRTCLGCIHDAAQAIRTSCTDQSDARIWYDYCFLRYSQQKFYGEVDTLNGLVIGNQENVTDVKSLGTNLEQLFAKIEREAVKPSGSGFSTGVKNLSKFDTLYAMAQCTKDLSSKNCAKCLNIANQNLAGFCSGRKGCRALYSTCSIRYELYPFFSTLAGSERKPLREALTKLVIRQ